MEIKCQLDATDLLHLVGILFPHNNDDARSKSLQIKVDLQEVGGNCGDWMELAQNRDRWRALVGTVRNFRVPKMRGIS